MNELLRLLATSLAFLLDPGRFRIVDSLASESFGNALVKLESEQARIMLVRDRSQVSIELQPVIGTTDEWFSTSVLRRVLEADAGDSDQLDPATIDFLHRRLGEIESRFSAMETRVELLRTLLATRQAMSREMWGD